VDRISSRCFLAISQRGQLVWTSARAEEVVQQSSSGRKFLDVLTPLAISFGRSRMSSRVHGIEPRSHFSLDVNGGLVHLELFFIRPRRGKPFVLVEIEDGRFSHNTSQLLEERYALTGAEKRVLAMLSLGLSNNEIAQRLYISKETARTHVHRILNKLGVSSRVQAALFVRKLG